MSLDEALAALEHGLYESGWCQRTTERRQSWRHVSEGGFNQRDYQVVPLAWKTARDFIIGHHYSGSFPAMKLRYGFVHRPTDRLVGVATFGPPQSRGVLTNPLPELDYTTATEWNRLVLLDEVPANAESNFGRAALRDAAEQGVRAVVSFADPVPRPDVGMPGHAGIIYQAMGFDYCGRGAAGDLLVLPNGLVLGQRSVQKIRTWERGSGGVVRRMVDAGAPWPEPGEDGKHYLRRAKAAVRPRMVAHPGNHRFVARLGRRARHRIALGDGYEPRPYPKHPDPAPAYR
jgi:hypothetical protein